MSMRKQSQPNHLFPRLALVTAILTAGLIIFGAIVRVTDSGLGCGNQWPLCDGRIVPPLDNLTAWIEWSHRLFALLIGAMGVGMLVLAVRNYRNRNPLVVITTLVAAGAFAMQSILGALVVVMDLPPTMVTLHLGTAMLLLASLLIASIVAWHRPPPSPYVRDEVTLLAYLTTALAFIIILTGALVRGSGATLACTDWPLCNGALFPFNQGELESVHMIHRLAVGGLGVSLVLLLWSVLRTRRGGLVRGLTIGAGIAFFAQALVGAVFVATRAAPVWGATHVALAALTWSLLVALITIDTLNSRAASIELSETQDHPGWTPQSESANH